MPGPMGEMGEERPLGAAIALAERVGPWFTDVLAVAEPGWICTRKSNSPRRQRSLTYGRPSLVATRLGGGRGRVRLPGLAHTAGHRGGGTGLRRNLSWYGPSLTTARTELTFCIQDAIGSPGSRYGAGSLRRVAAASGCSFALLVRRINCPVNTVVSNTRTPAVTAPGGNDPSVTVERSVL